MTAAGPIQLLVELVESDSVGAEMMRRVGVSTAMLGARSWPDE